MPVPSILIVDDDPSSADYMALVLERSNFATRRASSAIEALRSMESALPALVISDLQMPGMSGLDLLQVVRDRWPLIPVMLVTVEEDVATVVLAVQRGAVNYLIKPVSPPVLVAASAKALARTESQVEATRDDSTRDIVGNSEAMLLVRHMVALASRSDVNVMVVGETGTGKELVARAIHRMSGSPSRPFVAHNCAMTPPDMFDAEFFGHERGAFTGALRDRSGLLRDAHGGTLLLDELECLSLANQAKLLRVLDDGEVRAVGSSRPVSVSVRFVAATNRAPEVMLSTRELREDLYYRLRGFEVRLPPLRERHEDIAPLAEHFLQASGKHLEPACVETLRKCSWPGNIRQLRTVLQCAAARAAGPTIRIADLDLKIPGGIGWSFAPPPSSPAPNVASRSLPEISPVKSDLPPPETLESAEREAITRALEAEGGNRSRAARMLGIHRSTLARRMHDLGIVWGGHPGRKEPAA